MLRFLLFTGCLVCLPLLGGCLCGAYPKIDYTPSVKLDSPPNEVHAFRVDINKLGVVPFGGLIPVSPDKLRKRVEFLDGSVAELLVSPTGTVPAQIKPSVSYGFFFPIVYVNDFTHTSHSMAVRLYRPGYELVEIQSWELLTSIVWKPALDLETQEKVLDALMANHCFVDLTPAQRAALLFGAAEYERLAAATQSKDQQIRLANKAKDLREGAKE